MLHEFVERTLPEKGRVDGYAIEVPGARPEKLRVSARRIALEGDGEILTVLTLEEGSDRPASR